MHAIVRVILASSLIISIPLLAQQEALWVPTGKIYNLGGKVVPPSILPPSVDMDAAALPKVAKGGLVQFTFVVDDTGVPRLIHLVQTSDPNLTDAARRSLLRTRFRPATLDKRPVAVRMFLDMNFSAK